MWFLQMRMDVLIIGILSLFLHSKYNDWFVIYEFINSQKYIFYHSRHVVLYVRYVLRALKDHKVCEWIVARETLLTKHYSQYISCELKWHCYI